MTAFAERVKQRRLQAGVGMIEVLIAIVVAAFALLGLAGLQVSAMRYQKVSAAHGLASQYGAEMADRLRANSTASSVAGNPYVNVSDSYGANTVPGKLCNDPAVNVVPCTPNEVAVYDLYNWRVNLARGVPGGWGEVRGSPAAGYVVWVYYRVQDVDKNPAAKDGNCPSLGGATGVNCFAMVVFP